MDGFFFGELFDDRKDVELSLEQQNSAALVAYVRMAGGEWGVSSLALDSRS